MGTPIAAAALGLTVFAAALAPGAAAQTASSAVSIPDANLRDVIEDALDKQSGAAITEADMARLTTLNASYSGIRRVDGLEHSLNLRSLYLQGNRISSVSSLTGLARMQILFLQDNDISDLDITRMTGLRFLNVGNNNLSTIDLSSQRTRVGANNQTINSRLYALWLNGNRLASFDLTGLTALNDTSGSTSDPSLVSLRLDGNRMTSVTGLRDLPDAVWSLRLEDNRLASVDLRGAEHIHYLYLDRNPISSTASITGFSGLTDLRRLHLFETDISAIDLSRFSRLERAFLNDNNLASINVTGLDSIRRLWLRGNRIANITGLADVGDTLQDLNLRSNRLASIDLSGLTNLIQLYLSDNRLTFIDVAPLRRLQVLWADNGADPSGGSPPNPAYQNRITSVGRLPSSLTDLRLAGNPLDAPVSVSSRTGLRKLYVSGGQISGISEVSGLTGLTELALRGMGLASADLSSLSRLSSLSKLNLDGNEIVDVTPLASLSRLTELRVAGNFIADISPLSGMTALQDLHLADNHIGSFSPLDGLVAAGLTIHGGDDQMDAPDNFYWDVASAGSVHTPNLIRLAEDGVLDNTECGPGLICPRLAIERWVVAIWIVRVVDGVDPEPLGYNRFEDVHPGLQWATHVERLAELGITNGCSADPDHYCPQEFVTRAQMASLLTAAFDLPSGSPAGFDDVDSQGVHAAAIDSIASVGITIGCSAEPARYCPRELVTRAQMATFLERARTHSEEN